MASEKSLILRNAAARERLSIAITQIRDSGLEIPELKTTNRDALVAKTQELEYFADTMERVARHLKGEQKQVEPQDDAEQSDVPDVEESDDFRTLLTNKLREDKVELLCEAGFDSEQKLRDAKDEDLAKIQGIGQGTVDKLRAVLSTR